MMVYSQYDISGIGLQKSNYTGVEDRSLPTLSQITQSIPLEGHRMVNSNQQTGTENNSIFEQAFLGEIANTISIMESLYAATSRIDIDLANRLLEKALIDLRIAVRKIASELTLNMHRSLESGVIPISKTRKSKTKQTVVQEEPEKDIDQSPKNEEELPDINAPVRRNIFNNPPNPGTNLSFNNNPLYEEQIRQSRTRNPNPNASSGPVGTQGV